MSDNQIEYTVQGKGKATGRIVFGDCVYRNGMKKKLKKEILCCELK